MLGSTNTPTTIPSSLPTTSTTSNQPPSSVSSTTTTSTITTTPVSSMSEHPPISSGSLLENQEHEVVTLDQEKPHKRVILMALDDSPGSKHAFEWTQSHLLKPEDAIVLVHVRTAQMMIADFHGDMVLALHQLDDQAKKESHGLLQSYAKQLKGFKVIAFAIRGEPRAEVIRKAKELKADILVVGSRGRGFFQRTVLGSFSDYLVHHAPCPVMVVRPLPSSSSSSSSSSSRVEEVKAM